MVTPMNHLQLVNLAYKWVLKKTRCSFAFTEIKCINSEIADVIGFASGDYSVLVECKISKQDFFQDFKKPFRIQSDMGIGRYRFYACPAGLILPEELPSNWGLVYFNEKGKNNIIINPYCASPNGNIWSGGFNFNQAAERNILYSALRRIS